MDDGNHMSAKNNTTFCQQFQKHISELEISTHIWHVAMICQIGSNKNKLSPLSHNNAHLLIRFVYFLYTNKFLNKIIYLLINK
jgi:hypothetical protein